MRFLSISLLGLSLAAGCGGAPQAAPASPANEVQQPSGPVSVHGRSRYEVSVGPAGGRLELNNGIRVDIPAGALDRQVDITFYATTESRVFGRQEDQAAIGSAAQLEPTMATALPIEISIAFPGLPAGYTNDDLALGVETVSRQRGVESDDLQTYWQLMPARVQDGRLVARIRDIHGLRIQFAAAR